MSRLERDAQDHWSVFELLSRYAELLNEGCDAATMYPAIAAHLEQCKTCRTALEDLRTPTAPADQLALLPENLPFLQNPDQLQMTTRPGSDGSSFGVHISLPVSSVLDALEENHRGKRGPSRGYAPLQPGGRLLLYDNVAVGDEYFQVLLTIESFNDEMDRCTIVGELSGEHLPPLIKAHLYVGDDVYLAEACNGLMRFEQVMFDTATRRVTLSLETPD